MLRKKFPIIFRRIAISSPVPGTSHESVKTGQRAIQGAVALAGPNRRRNGPGDFRWRILEGFGNPPVFESVSCANRTFSAYDTALATGYGELQRLIGLELQHGPRAAPDAVVDFIRLASTPRPRPVERADPVKSPPVTGGGFTPRIRRPA